MYQQFYGLNEAPFSISPDPRFVFLSKRHQEALAHLSYGLGEQGGFMLLTGEVGTGKTTMSRYLIEQLPNKTDCALIVNPKLSAEELLASCCDSFELPYPKGGSVKALTDAINQFLLTNHNNGRNCVLIVDEAQHLTADALEQLRLLTNLETNTKKLLQVVLIGQPELQTLLDTHELRQLAQRITARYHLTELTQADMPHYIQHRLGLAGAKYSIFHPKAAAMVHRYSGGIARIANVICDRSLLAAYSETAKQVEVKHVQAAAKEVLSAKQLVTTTHSAFPFTRWRLTALALLLVGAATAIYVNSPHSSAVMVETPTVTEPRVAQPVDHLQAQAKEALTIYHQQIPHSQQQMLAFRGLFAKWNSVLYQALTPCESAQMQFLTCQRMFDGFEGVVKANAPAIIKLNHPQGWSYAVLMHIDAEQAQLQLGESVITVPLSWLAKQMRRDYESLMQPLTPPNLIDEHSPPAQLLWLDKQLSNILMLSPANQGNYNAQLQEKLRMFQRLKRLTVDGIAGKQTLMAIMQHRLTYRPTLKG